LDADSYAENIARARELLNSPAPQAQAKDPDAADADEPPTLAHPCPCCGGRMIIIETFRRGRSPRTHPASSIRIDTSCRSSPPHDVRRLVIFAGSPPATAGLIQIDNVDRNLLDLGCSTQMIFPPARCSPAATAANDAVALKSL
jgi:hypothetical protein